MQNATRLKTKVQRWSERITAAHGDSVAAIVAVGEQLKLAKADCSHGEWDELTGRTTGKPLLPFSHRTARMLKAIADGQIHPEMARKDAEALKERIKGPRKPPPAKPADVVSLVLPDMSETERAEFEEGLGKVLEEGGRKIAEFADRQAEGQRGREERAQRPENQKTAAFYRDILERLIGWVLNMRDNLTFDGFMLGMLAGALISLIVNVALSLIF